MRRLPTPCIARIRVILRKPLLNTAVYRLQPTYWKTGSDSRNRAITQPNRLLRAAQYWQSERAGCQDSSVAAGNFLASAIVWPNSLAAGVAACLAKELAPLGIFATTVEPAYFRTNFLASASLLRAENSIEDFAETAGPCAKLPSRSATISRAIRFIKPEAVTRRKELKGRRQN